MCWKAETEEDALRGVAAALDEIEQLLEGSQELEARNSLPAELQQAASCRSAAL